MKGAVNRMTTVVLLGTLDTKGIEYDYLRKRVEAEGCEVLLIDAGVQGEPLTRPDIPHDQVAAAAGSDVVQLAKAGDRGAAVETMARGATTLVLDLFAEGRLHGILGLGGSGGSSLATQAMRALPVGVPKLMVSTLASGETMFGVTTPCVTEARNDLEKRGYEVLVFHATGTGGQSMEALVSGGFLAGVLDITTTELADELVGGVLSAGPERLEVAGNHGLPQVVSLGALDMVNFGPLDSVPEKFRQRNLYKHNATVTLMRTTTEENAELGRIIARKLNQAKGPVALFIPLRGVSMIDVEGAAFYDAAADRALIDNLKAGLGDNVEVHELDMDI